MRIENTDIERSKEEYVENIYQGLQWLGINWDESPIIQSERVNEHKSIIKNLLCFGSGTDGIRTRNFRRDRAVL